MSGDAPAAPPGWYPDPEDPSVRRYWDGSKWTSPPPTAPPPTEVHSRAGPPAPEPPGGEPRQSPAFQRFAALPGVFWGALLACVGLGVGAVGTWATALGFISIAGTNGEDGKFVLGAAIVGLLALLSWGRWGSVFSGVVAALCGAVGATISAIDLHKLSGIGTSEFLGRQVHLVHAGWGIYLAVGAGTAFTLLTVAAMAIGTEAATERKTNDGAYTFGIGTVAVLIAVGVVIAVANIGTHNASSASAATSTSPPSNEQSATTPGETSTASTTPSTETTATTASASDPVAGLAHYWRDIDAHDFEAAYSDLAQGAVSLSKAEFVSSEEKAGITKARFHGEAASSSGSEATVTVQSLVTEDAEFGCRTWTGSYTMTDAGGTWRIEHAAITPHPCSR